MDITNRKQLLAFLRDVCKYDGKDDIGEVKAFLEERGDTLVDPEDKPINLDDIWAKTGGQKIVVGKGGETEDQTEDRLRGKSGSTERPAGAGKVVRADARMHSGGSDSRSAHKKAYDHRAKQGKTVFPDADMAEACGAFVRVVAFGKIGYPRLDEDLEILSKTAITTSPTLGAAVIPEDFNPQLIDLRESYGGFASVCRNEMMNSDVQKFPRITGDLTVYAPGEAGAITASDMTTDNVSVTATKMATLSAFSSEIIHDAAVNMVDQTMKNIVWSFKKKLEEIILLGDATSAYFNYIGFTYKFRKVLEDGGGTWTTDADKAKLANGVAAAGNLWSEITLANFQSVIGKHPQYDSAAPMWVCSKVFHETVMKGVAMAKSGVTSTEVVNGIKTDYFLGYPVKLAAAMPRVEANSQVCCLFGEPAKAGCLGEVKNSFSIATSDQAGFANDLIYIRGLIRQGVSVHDVGNYHATASSRVQGPMTALITLNA